MREFGAMYRVAELLSGRIIRIIAAQVDVIRSLAVGAPMPFIFSGLGIKDNNPMVAVPIGHNQLIRLRIDEKLGGPFQVFDIVLPLLRPGLPICIRNFPSWGNCKTILSW